MARSARIALVRRAISQQTAKANTTRANITPGAVAGLVGNEGGVVSEVFNLESSGVEAPDRRPRHDEALPRSLILRSLQPRWLLIFSTTGSIRSRPRCALGRAGSSKS